MATLSAYDIRQIIVIDYGMSLVHVTVFPFVSPHIGNMSFAYHMEEIGIKVLRLINNKDLVPKVPRIFINKKMRWVTRLLHWLPWAYVHVGVEITLNSSSSLMLKETYNPTNIHNLRGLFALA
ncbi:hypothetical protein SUGI_0887700 [Cryptomeria japonica]|nr:hypothetical protein SUGI_0887700 [Cryptomeria japonica]